MSKKVAILVFTLFFLLLGTYLAGSAFFYEKFTPGTRINGMDVSLMSRSDAIKLLEKSSQESYALAISDMDQRTFTLSGPELHLTTVLDPASFPWQNPLIFPYYLWMHHDYRVEGTVQYDAEAAKELIHQHVSAINRVATAPENAYLTTYIPGIGYEIAAAENGNQLKEDVVLSKALDSIRNLDTALTLGEECYSMATLQFDDPALSAQADSLNQYFSSSVSYELGDQRIVLTADTYKSWMASDESTGFVYDEAMLTDYVKKLKSITDTAYTERPFTTVSGRTIYVNGTYGYNLALKKEVQQLNDDLQSSTFIEREPVYQTTGTNRSVKDYGDSYLEVDMTNQKVYLVEHGAVSFSTDCVTGNVSRRRGTPTGLYSIMYKAKNVVLRGDNYASPVTYWMPFYQGCGFHDASWRGKFGGTIYRNNGSHGCVNLPIPSAKTIYEKISAGLPVILYY